VPPRTLRLSAAAVLLLALAACAASHPTGSRPARPAISAAQQSVDTAVAQTQRLSSATESLSVTTSGDGGSATIGTLLVEERPVARVSEILNLNGEQGSQTQEKVIFTATTTYLWGPEVDTALGNRWGAIRLADLRGGTAQLVAQLHQYDFRDQAELLTTATNSHVLGQQVIAGVATTEYEGSFPAASLLSKLPQPYRTVFGGLTPAGPTDIFTFRAWIDAQHHLLRLIDVEKSPGSTVNTTLLLTSLDQPVSITLPAASQTTTLSP
jgi:hypothetical protein